MISVHVWKGRGTMSDSPDLVLQPLVHVVSMEATVRFLEALGGSVVQGSRDGDWVQVAIGGAEVGLLAHPPPILSRAGRVSS